MRAIVSATWRAMLFLVVWGLVAAPGVIGLETALGDETRGPAGQLVVNAILLVAMLVAAWLVTVRIDRRPLADTGWSGRLWARGSVVGVLVGLALSALAASPLLALGRLEIRPVESVPAGLFVIGAASLWVNALLQELLFRGVLLTLFERFLGLRTAIGVSTALFLLAHAPALRAGWLPALSLLLAGLLLAAAFLATRELFFVTGLHWGWNAAQGLILGIPVSGHAFEPSLFSSTLADGILTGGEFGLEGGLAGVGATVVGLVAMSAWAKRRGASAGTAVR